jgi:hypothetical protein
MLSSRGRCPLLLLLLLLLTWSKEQFDMEQCIKTRSNYTKTHDLTSSNTRSTIIKTWSTIIKNIVKHHQHIWSNNLVNNRQQTWSTIIEQQNRKSSNYIEQSLLLPQSLLQVCGKLRFPGSSAISIARYVCHQ